MRKSSPTVSVVIPTYNRAYTVERSIRSVLAQSFRDFELIVVDDGSRDNTSEVIRNLNDGRIQYLRMAENQGASAARNRGIEHARGEYIAFQDSDDEWLPHKLASQLVAFDTLPRRVGVVYCKCKRLAPKRQETVMGEPFDRRCLLHHNFVDTPTMVLHRDCLRDERFDEELPRRQDWELCLRLAQRYEFAFVDEVLVVSRVTPGSVTSSQSRLLQAYRLILSKHHRLIRKSPKALAEFHYVIGTLLAQQGEWNDARPNLLKSLLYWPLEMKHWGRALVSLGGKSFYGRIFNVCTSR